MPLPTPAVNGKPTSKGAAIVRRRHWEWQIHNLRWRWLLDSFEAGEAYRTAVYGADYTFGLPVRNLIRHKHEYPTPAEGGAGQAMYAATQAGLDPAATANVDDYTLRLARTPVPEFLGEVVEAHLSRVYAKEVDRAAPDPRVEAWWRDVDGCGTSVDEWMSSVVAPLLMVFGCLDVIADHPKAPEDVEIVTRADQAIYGLDTCVASVILPENMVWWRLDARREYAECLVCEHSEDGDEDGRPKEVYRHWTAEGWTLYAKDGKQLGAAAHPFGRVPIKRLFDRRRPRTRNVGLPRYEGISEAQREYYNRDSELILSDTAQAHPLLQGPEDYVQADGTIPIGPSWLLPKKKNTQGGAATYEGFEVVDFPKDGAESIRKNLGMLRDRVDRAAMLTKPAGAAGTTGQTVSQSGVSKRLDQSGGNDLLSKIATTLQKAEKEVVELVLLVLDEAAATPEELEAVEVAYPKAFDLMTADELAASVAQFQAILASAGACPETEESLMSRLYRLMVPGLDDDDYRKADAEIKAYLDKKAVQVAQQHETTLAVAARTQADAVAPPGPAAGEADVPAGEGVA